MTCDHNMDSLVSTMVRTHPHQEPRARPDGSRYDEYECEKCHAFRVAANRKPNGIGYVFDKKGRRVVTVLAAGAD